MYNPAEQQATILNRALQHIASVPYTVSARWLFYRLLQDGLYKTKEDYHGKFLPLTAKARKAFFNGWKPNTLADDTRVVMDGGMGFDSVKEWLAAVSDQEHYFMDKWSSQDYYLEIWFEAKAMVGQFQHYTKDIPLMAFGGDVSIPAKWATAKRLERRAKQYAIPIKVLYFGDDDPKGQVIPQSAYRDIQAWCDSPFDFERVALNSGDGERLGIPDNPEKPGTYQWEALDDGQAGDIITDAVASYYNFDALEVVEQEEANVTKKFKTKIDELIKNWGD